MGRRAWRWRQGCVHSDAHVRARVSIFHCPTVMAAHTIHKPADAWGARGPATSGFLKVWGSMPRALLCCSLEHKKGASRTGATECRGGPQQAATRTATKFVQQTTRMRSACLAPAASHRLPGKALSGALQSRAFLKVPALGVLEELAPALHGPDQLRE